MEMDLSHQLEQFGLDGNSQPTVFMSSTGEPTPCAPGILPSEIFLKQAEIRTCEVQGVGTLPCLFSETGNVYEFVRTLRKCIYGKVKHAVRLQHTDQNTFVRTTDEVAIKVMRKDIIAQGNLQENPIGEIAVQQHLGNPGHPNVLTLIECIEDMDFIYAVLPFCDGGELFSVVETGGAMTEDQSRYWFSLIVHGLEYMQSRYICHRDLSLENVLLQGDLPKIIDFGLAIGIPVDANGMTYSLPPTGAVGKVFYMSPEIYRNQIPFNGFSADIWSSGIMLFIMVTGSPPFERPDLADARFQMIAEGRLSDMLDSWGMHHVSPTLRNLLSCMLVVDDPRKRCTVQEILNHPWIVGGN